MSEIDFDAINADALARCHGLLENLLNGGRVHGKEYVASSVRGGDGSSFKFNLESGLWSDFATGQSGSGLISLVAEARGISQVEAAKELAAMTGTILPQASPKSTANRKKEKPAVIVPVPENAPTPNMGHKKLGTPTAVYAYRNTGNRLLGYVCRFNKNEVGDNGKPKKEFFPLVYTERGWKWQALPSPRPFFGLERLALVPSDAPVLVLEGEGKADAVHGLISQDMAVLSLNGGSSGVGKNDFSPLKGRHVLFWPDNDEPGEKAARVFLQKAMEAGAASVLLVPIPEGKPKGWDAGDAVKEGWTQAQLLEHIYTAHPANTVETQPATDEPPADTNDSDAPQEKPKKKSIPFSFENRKNGLCHISEDGELTWLGPQLRILGLARDGHGKGWGGYVEWDDRDRKKHTRAIPYSLLTSRDASTWTAGNRDFLPYRWQSRGLAGHNRQMVSGEQSLRVRHKSLALRSIAWTKRLRGVWSQRLRAQLDRKDNMVQVCSSVWGSGAYTRVSSDDGGGYGNQILIRHNDGTFSTLYAHCSKVDVSVGQTVKQGQKIGEVGNTGNSSGPHLYFEVRQNGTAVNPRNYINF